MAPPLRRQVSRSDTDAEEWTDRQAFGMSDCELDRTTASQTTITTTDKTVTILFQEAFLVLACGIQIVPRDTFGATDPVDGNGIVDFPSNYFNSNHSTVPIVS